MGFASDPLQVLFHVYPLNCSLLHFLNLFTVLHFLIYIILCVGVAHPAAARCLWGCLAGGEEECLYRDAVPPWCQRCLLPWTMSWRWPEPWGQEVLGDGWASTWLLTNLHVCVSFPLSLPLAIKLNQYSKYSNNSQFGRYFLWEKSKYCIVDSNVHSATESL